MADETQLTPHELFEQIPNYFQPEKAGSTAATVQFDLSGPEGGQWWVKIADGKLEHGQGTIEGANLTLLASAEDYVKVFTGKMDPTMAFMQGKVKIKGDTMLAMKLPVLFKRP